MQTRLKLDNWKPRIELPQPIDSPTGTQEALSSYLYRLKRALSSEIHLIIEELRLSYPTLNKREFISCLLDSNTIPFVYSGSGISAQQISTVLSKMVPAHEWETHTLNLFENTNDFAAPLRLGRRAGWCRSCLSDAHATDTAIYWPLAWLTKGYDQCHTHKTKLCFHCDICGEAKSGFNTNLPLDICGYCKAPLYDRGIPDNTRQLELWKQLRSDTIITRLSCQALDLNAPD